MNKILHGDCLEVMNELKDESIDLIYLDPPFFTNKNHKLRNRNRDKEFSFSDLWSKSQDYANFIHDRISIMKKLLKDTGSIFVHCDKSANHIIRLILDDIFGEKNFRSEIIWSYKRWSNTKKGLMQSHQNIFFYSKSRSFKFKKIFMPYAETTNIDQILQNRSRDKYNKSIYKLDLYGVPEVSGKKKGVPLSDVWEIPYLNPKAKERVGYPTQKPILLLERIIELCTEKNDVVLDPFCGSGTTCVASKLLNREYIGIDESEDAIKLTKSRLINPVKTSSELLKKGRSSYINVDKNVLVMLNGLKFDPVQRNRGIDAILKEQFEDTPVLIKVQKSNEHIHESIELLKNAVKKKGSKRAFLIQTRDFEIDIKFPKEIINIQSPSYLIKIKNI